MLLTGLYPRSIHLNVYRSGKHGACAEHSCALWGSELVLSDLPQPLVWLLLLAARHTSGRSSGATSLSVLRDCLRWLGISLKESPQSPATVVLSMSHIHQVSAFSSLRSGALHATAGTIICHAQMSLSVGDQHWNYQFALRSFQTA